MSPTRRRRVLLTLLGAGAGFVGLIGPWPLDSTPDEQVVAAALAQAREAGRELAVAQPGPLHAGWARRELRLKPGLPLAGYGERHSAPSAGSTEPLYARAVAMRTPSAGVVLVCADLLLINRELADEVERRARAAELALPPLFFTATHTHSGPGAWGELFLEEQIAGDFDRRARDALAEDIANAVTQAWAELRPAEWAFAVTNFAAGVRNRTVPGGSVDGTLEALLLRQTETGARAALVIYGAHATCRGPQNLEFSGDYPSALVRCLEGEHPDLFAAFAAGCVGSQAPQADDEEGEKAQALARNLADTLRPLVDRAAYRPDVRLAAQTRTLPLPGLQLRVAQSARLAPWITGRLHDNTGRFGLLRLDHVLWLGLPMELSGMLSADLRDHARRRTFHLALTCFSGDYAGYVLPDEVYANGSLYESRMSFLGPGGGSFTKRLIESVAFTANPGRNRIAADGSQF